MRIMLDTNVLISMILFPSQDFKKMLKRIIEGNTLVLSSFVIEELKEVTARKFPAKMGDIDRFLTELSFEMVYTPDSMDHTLFEIRDVNDYPVLYSAIISNSDILITGDSDFMDVQIERPAIMTPRDFINKYSS